MLDSAVVQRLADAGDHREIVRLMLAENVSPKSEYFALFLGACLKAGKFRLALDSVAGLSQHAFERAYALHRTQRHAEALALLGSVPRTFRNDLLRAQVLYADGRFQEAFKLYSDLQSTNKSKIGVRINMSACSAHFKRDRGPSAQGSADCHEILFNEACGLIRNSEFGPALERLDSAEAMCREDMSQQEYSEHEIAQEISAITAQRLAIGQMAGRASLEELRTLHAQKGTDRSLFLVLANNLSAADPKKNLFSHIASLDKLLPHQRHAFERNRAAKYSRLSASKARIYGETRNDHLVLGLLLSRRGQHQEAASTILRSSNPYAVYATVHWIVNKLVCPTSDILDALIPRLEEQKHVPAVFACALLLFRSIGKDRAFISQWAKSAIDSAGQKDTAQAVNRAKLPLLKYFADHLRSVGEPDHETMHMIEKIDPEDMYVAANRVLRLLAGPKADADAALELARSLPAVPLHPASAGSNKRQKLK